VRPKDGIEVLAPAFCPTGIESGKQLDLVLEEEPARILVWNAMCELPPTCNGVRGRLKDGEEEIVELGEAASLEFLTAFDDDPVVTGVVHFDMRVAKVA
jgi:hypothetical protein